MRIVAFLAAIAVAGTPGADVLRGTPDRDVIHADRGDDRVAARGGWDWVDGGLGDDVLYGGDDPDILYGGPGHDVLVGGAGADVMLVGNAGNDTIDAREPPARAPAKDCRPCDPLPRGAEFVRGGAGDDRIIARDGLLDAVSCGSGHDVAILDRRDRIVRINELVPGCEVVRRR